MQARTFRECLGSPIAAVTADRGVLPAPAGALLLGRNVANDRLGFVKQETVMFQNRNASERIASQRRAHGQLPCETNSATWFPLHRLPMGLSDQGEVADSRHQRAL